MRTSKIDYHDIDLINKTLFKSLALKEQKTICLNFINTGLQIFGAEYGYAYIYTGSKLTLLTRTESTPYIPKPPRSRGTLTTVLKSGVPKLFGTFSKNPTVRADAKENMKACIVIPLQTESNKLGVMVLAYSKTQVFRSSDTIKAALLGSNCGNALSAHQLNTNLKLYKDTIDQTGLITMFVDEGGFISYANKEARAIFSQSGEKIAVKKTNLLSLGFPRNFIKKISEAIENKDKIISFEHSLKIPQGKMIPVKTFLQPLNLHDSESKVLLLVDNIEERKLYESMLYKSSRTDELTGLTNRRGFNEKIAEKIARSISKNPSKSKKFAILFVDLDRFKTINDILGHDAGDELLKLVAKRLQNTTKKTDHISRIGGDEFVVILNSIHSNTDVKKVCKRLLSEFQKPFFINNEKIFSNISIGSSIFPSDGLDAETLIKSADIALYASKHGGRGIHIPYSSKYRQTEKELTVEKDIRNALENDELELYYQPQISSKTGKVHGLEALIRWNHSTLGTLTPDNFIPLAEENGIINQISKWVINRAVEDLSDFHKELPDLAVSINLSIRDLVNINLSKDIKKVLAQSKVKPEHLRIEITETQAIKDPDLTIKALKSILELGIECWLDDFGTGNTSIKYLSELPLSGIKIDKAFISQSSDNERVNAILKSLSTLSKDLNLGTIVEGVENKQQLKNLQKLGFDITQGYIFSKPISKKQIETWLKTYTK